MHRSHDSNSTNSAEAVKGNTTQKLRRRQRGNETPGMHGRTPSKVDSQATTLVALAGDAELFHDRDVAFARIPVMNHFEVWRLECRTFKAWLQRQYWGATKAAASSQAVSDAIGVLRGKALFEGQQRTTSVRIAKGDNCIWLNLANESWQAVRIDPTGWEVVDVSDVPFIRPRGVLPLPTPVHGGSLNELRELINVESDDDWILILAWLVASLHPSGPYPVLSVNGEQGSAKSTLCRILRALVDPNEAALRTGPRDERDLVIAATNGHVLALENLSQIPIWLSDALCRLATGGGLGTRALFSDGEEKLFSGQRPVMLNGINELCTRSDLLDRAIVISLSAIPEQRRTTESDLWARFEQIRGRMLGALLDAVSQACSALEDVQLASLPRMADFAKCIVAAEPALPCAPGGFLLAYQGNRAAANESAIESSVLSEPVQAFMVGREEWQGTATDLKSLLEEQAGEACLKAKFWPKRPHQLSRELKRIAPNLRRVGINIEFGKSGNRFIRLTKSGVQNGVHGVQRAQPDGSGEHESSCRRTQDPPNTNTVHSSSLDLRGLDALDAKDAESHHGSNHDAIDIDWADDVFQ